MNDPVNLLGCDRGCLHEVLGEAGRFDSAVSFGLALAVSHLEAEDHLVWARQEAGIAETGFVYGPGLAGFGCPLEQLTLLKLRTATDVLRAGLEVARCLTRGVVVLDLIEGGRKADLTATRRLKLAAEASGASVILVRPQAQAVPSAAHTRWLARAAPLQSAEASQFPADARACFDLTLLRHRAGLPERRFLVEWNHDRRIFAATPDKAVSERLDAVSQPRSLAA